MRGVFARAARTWLGFVALMSAAASASASGNVIAAPGVSGGSNTAWTVYAFGNAQAVSDALRSLTNFAASGTFQSIVSMVAVIGVLGVGLSGGFNPAMAKRFIGYVVGVFITCYALFGVTNGGPLVVNIEVIDSVDNTWKAPVTVPAVVGIPASMISTAGYQLTRAIEASFPIPDELKMSNGAPFNLVAAMLNDASQAKITDPNLASSLAYYAQDCFTVGVAQGALTAQTLITSSDFLNDIHFSNQAIMVNTLLQDPVGQPGIVSCDAAWNLINNKVNEQGTTASGFLKNASAWSQTPALNVVDADADRVLQYATNNGINDGGAAIKQAAVLSAFKSAYSQTSAQTGNNEFLTNIAMAQATEAQRTSWIVGAEIFNRTMGYIFAILQVFVYAITPLVLCAALVPGLGLALLKNFAQIMLWLAIWQPMLAIVNFIVISMQQSDLGGALSTGTGGYGFTLQNMGIITEKTSNLRAAASFVGTMVPALAWAMVKGSVDFSRVIGSAVGENFAAGAANTMATGGYSINNASMDSFTANKHSIAATGAWGNGQNTNSATGSAKNDWGGSELPTKEGQHMSMTPSMQMGTQHAGSAGTAASDGIVGGTNAAASHSAALASGATDQSGGGTSSQSGLTTNAGANAGVSGQYALVRGGGGGGAGGGGHGSVAPGQTGAMDQTGQPIQTDGKKPGRASANLTGQISAGVQGSQSEMFTNQHNHMRSTSGTATDTGSTGATGGRNASDIKNAQQSRGYNEAQTVSVQGWASEARRAEMMDYANQDNGSDFLAIARDSRNAQQPAPTNPTGQFLQTAASPRGIQGQVEDMKKDVSHTEDKLAATAQELKGNAERQAKQNTAAADSFRGQETANANATENPAKVGAFKRLTEPVTEEGKKLYDATKGVMQRVADAAPGAAQAMAAAGMAEGGLTFSPDTFAAGNKPGGNTPTTQGGNSQGGNTTTPKSGAPDAAQTTNPGNQNSPGKAPEHQTGHQVAQHANGGGHPGQGGGNQGQGGTPAAKVAENSQAAAAPHAAGNASGDAQKPGEKKDEKQQQRESQPQQQAAADPMPQPPMPQVAQMQQPLPQPEPQQVAQMPTPPTPQPDSQGQQPQQQAGLPNIFDGAKKDEGAGAQQGQVQMAEQRAERSETQRRNADHVLASAENKKPNELPDLINQARDFTRTS